VAEKQFVPSEHRQVTRDGVSYPVTSYSHDIVDMTLINHIITEADESSDIKKINVFYINHKYNTISPKRRFTSKSQGE
jgi:hypothetical protein